MTSAEREMLDDSLRVVSLSFSYLDGARSIPPYLKTDTTRGYSHLIYVALGEHYLKTERIRDAAESFVAYADAQPLDPRAAARALAHVDIEDNLGLGHLALRFALMSGLRRRSG